MGKKYEKYKILIKYLNSDIEEINLSGINTYNYNEMIKVYKNVKKNYTDKGILTIDFLGIGQDGNLGILFRKEIKNKNCKTELKEDIVDISNRISKDMLLIKDKFFYHCNMIDSLNKKEDVFLHSIESFKNKKFKNKQDIDKEKIKIFDILENLRNERRWHKEQLEIIQNLQQNNFKEGALNVTHLSNVFKLSKPNKYIKFLDLKVAEQKKIYKEEIIKNKENQVNKLKGNYEKIVIDEASNRIIAYNKAKCI